MFDQTTVMPAITPSPERKPKTTLFVTGSSESGLNPPSEMTGEKVGWADVFESHIYAANAIYANETKPGHSLRDYFHRGILNQILEKVSRGDVILACHGHLEGAPLTRIGDRARGCLPGTGSSIVRVYDAYFKREEVIHTFEWYVKELSRQCHEHEVILVLLSPPVRCAWVKEKILRTRSIAYAEIMRSVGEFAGARYMDFASATEQSLNNMGPECARSLYLCNDKTHTNARGAEVYAKLLSACLLEKFPEVFKELLKH